MSGLRVSVVLTVSIVLQLLKNDLVFNSFAMGETAILTDPEAHVT